MFVAGKSINVTRNDKLVALNPGDPCPEAATWPQDVLTRCMKVGQILNVERAGDPNLPQMQAAQHARNEANRIASVSHKVQTPAPTQALASTHEVNRGEKNGRALSTTDARRAKRKAS